MRRVIQLMICCGLLVDIGVPHASDVYKWVDEKGKVHYGDRPTHGSARQVPLRSKPPADESLRQRHERQNKLLQVMEEERQLRDEQRLQAKAHQAQREQECATAKFRLRRYQEAGEIYLEDASGKQTKLPKEQQQEAIADAKARVEAWCD